MCRHSRIFFFFFGCAGSFAAHDILLVIATHESAVIMTR